LELLSVTTALDRITANVLRDEVQAARGRILEALQTVDEVEQCHIEQRMSFSRRTLVDTKFETYQRCYDDAQEVVRLIESAGGGLIANLSCQKCGNVHAMGAVVVRAQSGLRPHVVADLLSESEYVSECQFADQWISYDFKGNVNVRAYELFPGKGPCKPRDWVIEGSGNGREWSLLNEQKEWPWDQSGEAWVPISPPVTVRIVRVRQVGGRNLVLCLRGFEVFGGFV
jgi:hypothetical protein